MNNVKLLWLLQEIEKKEKELLSICRTNPMLKDLKKYKEEILIRQNAFENAKNMYQDITLKIKHKENEIKNIMDKQKEILKKLYDGSVTHSKELTKMQQQSQQLKEKALENEDSQLKDMEEKERIYTYLKQEQENLKNELESYKNKKMRYDLEKMNSEQELAQIGDEKTAIILQIPEKLLKKFRDMQKTYNGQPITLVGANRLCSVCNVEVIRTIADKAIQESGKISCESCGRIIYIAD